MKAVKFQKIPTKQEVNLDSSIVSPPPPLPPRRNSILSNSIPNLPPRPTILINDSIEPSTPILPPRPLPPSRKVSSATSSSIPLVDGLTDIQLYTLLRRWNKQIRHLKKPITIIENQQLDLESNELFHPDLLRSNIERFYINVISKLVIFTDEIIRLRDWNEPIRTSSFALVYFLSWSSKSIGIGVLLSVVTAGLIAFPSFRSFLFPPKPIIKIRPLILPDPLISTTIPPLPPTLTSEIDTLTTEESVELEAVDFAEDLTTATSLGRNNEPTVEEILSVNNEIVEDVNNPPAIKVEDKVKFSKLSKVGLPIQTILGELSDMSERIQNLLSSNSKLVRFKVASYLIPIILLFSFCPISIIINSVTLLIGILFFGDPLIKFTTKTLDNYLGKGWEKKLELRHSILKGIPTNSQLTLSLLRLSELAGKPLPPPPRISTPISTPLPTPPTLSTSTSSPIIPTSSNESPSSIKRNDSQTSLIDYPDVATMHSPSSSSSTGTTNTTNTSGSGKKVAAVKSRFAAFVRGAAKVTEESSSYISGHKSVNWEKVSRIAVDKIKATTGASFPEHIMTIIPKSNVDDESSCSIFYGHQSGRPGHLLLSPPTSEELQKSSSWYLEFVPLGGLSASKPPLSSSILRPRSSSSVSSSIPPTIPTNPSRIKIKISSITSLKKTSELGWKSRLTAQFLMGVLGEGDGIEIVFKDLLTGSENCRKFNAILRRDELFNRLASLDCNTFWESV